MFYYDFPIHTFVKTRILGKIEVLSKAVISNTVSLVAFTLRLVFYRVYIYALNRLSVLHCSGSIAMAKSISRFRGVKKYINSGKTFRYVGENARFKYVKMATNVNIIRIW